MTIWFEIERSGSVSSSISKKIPYARGWCRRRASTGGRARGGRPGGRQRPGGPPYRIPAGCPQRTPPFRFHYHFRMFYRRRLPHLYRADQSIFLTGRLYGSLPPNRYFPAAGVASGKVFAVLDRLLDEARTGPVYCGVQRSPTWSWR